MQTLEIGRSQVVHCQIGSLETDELPDLDQGIVHCQIGSLENRLQIKKVSLHVHCQIGSLEILL